MPLAKVIGFPTLPTGTSAVSGSIWIEQLEDWADGNVSVASVVEGALHSTLFNKWAVPVTNGDLYVAATPTGTGVKKGPRTRVRWELLLSNGKNFNNGDGVVFEELLANSSGEWSVNSEPRIPALVTNAGTPPAGLDVPTAQALFVEDGQVATTGGTGVTQLATNVQSNSNSAPSDRVLPASNLHATRHLRGGADETKYIGQSGGLSIPAAPTLTFLSGQNITLTDRTATPITTRGATENEIVFEFSFTRIVPSSASGSFYSITPPSGWSVAGAYGAEYSAALVASGVFLVDGLLAFQNTVISTMTTSVYIRLAKN